MKRVPNGAFFAPPAEEESKLLADIRLEFLTTTPNRQTGKQKINPDFIGVIRDNSELSCMFGKSV